MFAHNPFAIRTEFREAEKEYNPDLAIKKSGEHCARRGSPLDCFSVFEMRLVQRHWLCRFSLELLQITIRQFHNGFVDSIAQSGRSNNRRVNAPAEHPDRKSV